MHKKEVHGLGFSSDSELGRTGCSNNKEQPELHRVQVDPTDFAFATKRLALDAANFALIGGFENQGSDRFFEWEPVDCWFVRVSRRRCATFCSGILGVGCWYAVLQGWMVNPKQFT